MKLKLKDVVEAHAGLIEIAKAKLAISHGVKLARAIKVVAGEAQLFAAKRDELVQKYGTPVKDKPGQFLIPPEQQEDYVGEMKELGDTEIDVTFEVVALPPTLEVPTTALIAAGVFVKVQDA